jgi:transmembrane sensor
VRVEATDASFVVARSDAASTVTVTRGSVRVLWAIGEADLLAGESGTFPPTALAPPPSASQAVPPPTVPASSPSSAASSDWRGFAREGDFDRAYAELGAQGGAVVRDDIGDLLLAADVARMSHHPAQAIDPLRRAVRNHRGDPRAPLAAFTLGRVLLDELGRPREAADAFADARAIAPGGPLAEDALAREVEAASRAGDASRASARAQLYVTTYPAGARIRSVRRYGGLE